MILVNARQLGPADNSDRDKSARKRGQSRARMLRQLGPYYCL